jgi:hypothetical protein
MLYRQQNNATSMRAIVDASKRIAGDTRWARGGSVQRETTRTGRATDARDSGDGAEGGAARVDAGEDDGGKGCIGAKARAKRNDVHGGASAEARLEDPGRDAVDGDVSPVLTTQPTGVDGDREMTCETEAECVENRTREHRNERSFARWACRGGKWFGGWE